MAGFADYAFYIQGLLDLYEASFDIQWLVLAEELQSTQDRLFWDGQNGGYFTSAGGRSNIVIRMKEDNDNAEPRPAPSLRAICFVSARSAMPRIVSAR